MAKTRMEVELKETINNLYLQFLFLGMTLQSKSLKREISAANAEMYAILILLSSVTFLCHAVWKLMRLPQARSTGNPFSYIPFPVLLFQALTALIMHAC